MELDPVFLSRLQLAFVISFHIVFPAFTIGLAAWLATIIASGNWTAKEIGLEAYPPDDRPPVVIPFFAFRVMVGMGLIMAAISWGGLLLVWRGRLDTARWFLWAAFLSFPTGFVEMKRVTELNSPHRSWRAKQSRMGY